MNDYNIDSTGTTKKEMRINALKQALRQSESDAIVHMECVLSALLTSMTPAAITQFTACLAEFERIAPETYGIVKLQGEPGGKSQRQLWREELIQLETGV